MPPLVQAALLGVVQGLTEFLPVSSSAHLILARMFFGFDGEKFGLAFDVATHIGTLLAVIAYFHKDLRALILSLPQLFRPAAAATGDHVRIDRQDVRPGAEGARLIWLLVVGTLPAVVLGVLIKGAAEARLRTPGVAAVALAVGALAFFAAERLGAKRRNEESLTAAEAFWIGCAQAAAAIVPGVSRSGATITIALLFGLRRAEAARFTFLLGIPAVLAAAGKTGLELRHVPMSGELATIFAVGIVSSGIVGYLAIRFLLRYLAAHRLDVFAYYRLALAAVVWWFVH